MRYLAVRLASCAVLLSACSGGGGEGSVNDGGDAAPSVAETPYACPSGSNVGSAEYSAAVLKAYRTAWFAEFATDWCAQRQPSDRPFLNHSLRAWITKEGLNELQLRAKRISGRREWANLQVTAKDAQRISIFNYLNGQVSDPVQFCQEIRNKIPDEWGLDTADPASKQVVQKYPVHTPSVLANYVYMGLKESELMEALKPIGASAPLYMGGELRAGVYSCSAAGGSFTFDMNVFADGGMHGFNIHRHPPYSWEKDNGKQQDAKDIFNYTLADGAFEIDWDRQYREKDASSLALYSTNFNMRDYGDVDTWGSVFRYFTDSQCKSFLYSKHPTLSMQCVRKGPLAANDQSPVVLWTHSQAQETKPYRVEAGKGVPESGIEAIVGATSPIVLLKDGTAYLDPEFPMDELDVAASRAGQPTSWNVWRLGAAGGYEMKYPDGWRSYSPYVAEKLPASWFNAKYKSTSGGATGFGAAYTSTIYKFLPNGRWAKFYESASYASSPFVDYTSSWGDSEDGAPVETGSYWIDGFTLTMHYDRLDRVERVLMFHPIAGQNDVMIGNMIYAWKGAAVTSGTP